MQKNYSPIDVNSLPYFVDMKAMRAYAQEKGVSISSLTNSEKERFTKEVVSPLDGILDGDKGGKLGGTA